MKKNEFIHLHALLIEVREELTASQDYPSDAFREYDACDSGPAQIQQNKQDHRQAVDMLCLGLIRVLSEEDVSTRSRQNTTSEDTS